MRDCMARLHLDGSWARCQQLQVSSIAVETMGLKRSWPRSASTLRATSTGASSLIHPFSHTPCDVRSPQITTSRRNREESPVLLLSGSEATTDSRAVTG